MKAEAKKKLATLEEVVMEAKRNLRKTLWESIQKISTEFPEDEEEIKQEYEAMCHRYGIDFFSEMKQSWEEGISQSI